jgi:glycosyltransferase involved in cell wall biosynthesis
MRSVVLVVPGQLETPTGGYIYDRRMAEGLRQHGWSVDVRALHASFPHPTPAALEHASRVLAGIGNGTCVLVDGLAFGAMPDVIEREASRLRIAALIHLPLGADLSIDRETAARLAATERRALDAAALVIVTGPATLSLLAEYGIARDKVVVVEPGTTRVPLARRPGGGPLKLLSVATLHPGKGHEILLNALATVAEQDWRLTCAGSVTRHAATADRVRAALRRLGLEERVALVGELDDAALCHCYDEADVFVLATLQETYGMAVAEALAHGLPVVATRTGAIPDLVGDDAGLLVPPGNTEALADALARVLGDARLRARLTEGAWRARDRLPSWDQAIKKMSDVLACLDAHG